MILNCAIVDDEPLALELLRSYVEKTSFLRLVGRYSSAVQAMTEIPLHEEVHVLFLDIQMPELNGLEFSRMVSPETRIIFTTAFGQYALDSYKVNALDYLLKPISYVDFLQSVNKAVQWYELKQKADNGVDADEADDCIYVKSDYKLLRIALDRILYIEGLKDYIKIHVEDEPKAILSLISMKAMEEKLPSSRFIRVHRSFIFQKSKNKSRSKAASALLESGKDTSCNHQRSNRKRRYIPSYHTSHHFHISNAEFHNLHCWTSRSYFPSEIPYIHQPPPG